MEPVRITDGHNRTVDVILCKDGKYMAVMFEAGTDYHQNAWFMTKEEAMHFGENWVWKR